MRNSQGVEVKKGMYVFGVHPNGIKFQGTVLRSFGGGVYEYRDEATGDQWSFDAESVTRARPAETRSANPLTRVKVMSPPQRPAGTRAKPGKRLVARRKKTAKAPEGFYANPLIVAEKAVNRRSLVGSVQYAVLFYSGKNKPSGKPDFVIPARDKKHAHAFVEQLRDKGASGVAVVEKTTNRV